MRMSTNCDATARDLSAEETRHALHEMGAVKGRMRDGYVAAQVISRLRVSERHPREAFTDTSLAFGQRWTSAEEGLAYAINTARQLIRNELSDWRSCSLTGVGVHQEPFRDMSTADGLPQSRRRATR